MCINVGRGAESKTQMQGAEKLPCAGRGEWSSASRRAPCPSGRFIHTGEQNKHTIRRSLLQEKCDSCIRKRLVSKEKHFFFSPAVL
jgi:hypothetical protein